METQLVYPPETTDIDELRDGWLKTLFTQTGASSFTHIREKNLTTDSLASKNGSIHK